MSKQGLAVIKIPVKYQQQIRKAEKLKTLNQVKSRLVNIQGGNKKHPLITCKTKKLNFYKGQTYNRSIKVPLASENWHSRKSQGDHFTIHGYGENPAYINIEEAPTFKDLGLNPFICGQFEKMGFEHPTNIQAMAIPKILDGSNTIVSAETGNGKTYAYLAPLIQDIMHNKMREKSSDEEGAFNSPKALVIVPGRELVGQTVAMARDLCGDLDINVNALVGGRTKRIMTNPMMLTPDILVASFGALSKLTTTGIYRMDLVRHVVLDEADTLLDDSFNEMVMHFLSKISLKGKREEDDVTADTLAGAQLTLVGATFPTSVDPILKDIVEVDSLVRLKTPYLHRILPHVTQIFQRVSNMDVPEKLLRIAKVNYKNRIPTLIFSNDSRTSNWASLFLNNNEVPCINLNSSVPRPLRRKQFSGFQHEAFMVMSCTDLVSRGLNTFKAEQVINLQFPHFMADYIHRCGRTGRVGVPYSRRCKVINFIRSSDSQLVNKIEFSIRKQELLPNVNANIKRIITERNTKAQPAHIVVEE